ncbi:MAG: hypothetical protein DA405_05600 [Bacteroidetes bacterium]|nr:MAG: hypothetical protein DA405_05600 [Bacteroidota bacterium]
MRHYFLGFLAFCFIPFACADGLAKEEMQSKAQGLYRGKISFVQGKQYIALELGETGHYSLSYSPITDSTKLVKENGVYVLGKDGIINLARRSMFLRNFKLSQDDKILLLNSSAKPYTTYADSSFYLNKISKIAD